MNKIPNEVYEDAMLDQAKQIITKRSRKVWDVVPAKDSWSRGYAHLEYKRIGWHNLWHYVNYIEVRFV